MVAQLDKQYIRLSKERAFKRFLSYLLFEGRPHSTRGQWFNPIVFLVLKTLMKFKQQAPVQKPIFIVGLGRSGTTVLGLIMSMHKDLGYLNEPKAIWSLIDERTDTVDDYVLQKGQLHLKAADSNGDTASKATRLFSHYLRIIGRPRLLDKFPEHVFRVDYLLSMFPDAKIIFISRSGNDAVASIAKWSKDHETRASGNVENWWGRNDAKWHYICQQVLIADRYRDKLSEIDLAGLDQINRAALEWIITMDEGLNVMATHSEKVFHVRYASLLENPDEFMQSILEYCELSWDPQVLQYARSTIYQQTPKPTPTLLEPIAELFATTSARLSAQTANPEQLSQ